MLKAAFKNGWPRKQCVITLVAFPRAGSDGILTLLPLDAAGLAERRSASSLPLQIGDLMNFSGGCVAMTRRSPRLPGRASAKTIPGSRTSR